MKEKNYEPPAMTVNYVHTEGSIFCSSSIKEETDEAEEIEIEVDNSEGNNLQGSSNCRNSFMDDHTWK